MRKQQLRRGGRIASALAVAALAFGVALVAGLAGRPPAGEPVDGYRAAEVHEDADGVIRVENHGARERLIVYDAPTGRVQLLFIGDAPANALPDGRSLWPDTEGGRVVEFDEDGLVAHVYQGAPQVGPPLNRPLFALRTGDQVWAVEGDGSILRFRDGAPVEWRTAGAPAPPAAVSDGRLVAARTVREFDLGPVGADEPLLWLLEPAGASASGLGRVQVPDNAFLGGLVNTGWVAAHDGAIYFAPALEAELLRYAADGRLAWRATRPARPSQQPRFTAVGGQIQPLFDEVQHGVVVGPDGRIYVLGRGAGGGRTLNTFDQDGTLVRSGEVPARAAIFADRSGRIHAIPAEQALARVDAQPRAPFPAFELESLDGVDTLRLEALRGRVSIVNFWASWCGPCREEMPALDAYARRADPARVAIVGLNEDTDPDAARAFLDQLGGIHYPVGAGHGRLRSRYGYRGLPYTVVLDPELRVVKVFYGFGESLDPVIDVVEAELERADGAATVSDRPDR